MIASDEYYLKVWIISNKWNMREDFEIYCLINKWKKKFSSWEGNDRWENIKLKTLSNIFINIGKNIENCRVDSLSLASPSSYWEKYSAYP